MTTGDLLIGGADQRRGRRRPTWPAPIGVTIGALALAIAVVMASGIVAAVRLSGGGPQPEDVLPASTFAMARLDLDPAASQKLAVRSLSGMFPDAPGDDLIELRDALASDAINSLGLSYDEDVRPWLGDRYAVAGFVVSGEVEVVVVVQTRDEGKARAAVESAEADAGIGFLDGFALLGESQDVVDAAITQSNAGTLAEDPEFTEDVSSLAGDQIAVGWIDVEVFYDEIVRDLVGEFLGDLAPEVDLDGVRVALGLHATRDYVELETHVIGGPDRAAGTGDISSLVELPTATMAAVHLADASVISAGLGAFAALSGLTGAVVLPDGTAVEPLPASSGDPIDTGLLGQLGRIIDALSPVSGQLTNELLPLLTGPTTVALGSLPGGASSRSDLSLLLAAKVAAPGNAEVPLLKARDALRAAGLSAAVTIRGATVYAATGSAYVEGLGTPGVLGESELFQKAMGELNDQTTFAAYVDLTDIARLQSDYPQELLPVQAVGMTASSLGSRTTVRVRVVIG